MSAPRVQAPLHRAPFDPAAAFPRLLVSVRDADEADLSTRAGADLVDAKDPARGALGGLPSDAVRAIVERVERRAPTSAVAGEAEAASGLLPGIAAMAGTGVDYVKVAVRDVWSRENLAALAAAAPGRLIAVLFAETMPVTQGAADLVSRLARAGFLGAMIDTAGKDGRRLTDHLPPEALAAFTRTCRSQGLLSGLAGSLALADIAALAPLGAHYLGFRGGLCEAGDRRRGLESGRVMEAVRALRAHARRDAA
ncbi:(5-formylfuran-3-yl)methyl phosphate synthase [Methylobacterium sp. J-068]|uniref:(5-formylfuran-3-yl)methyl phosphate synthase n=1 Tax=Methylobacterium sp. J-068 TaxID=2836649 RepID=UPI001FBBC9EA|nr:(5-formylfuran-3-yl)methyl phosphate synthase [Methylobacterium sp. J-068]MCJ2034986.1 (5-formylfuran-3-yl)methyl phosphate synthase [Methylobacterium sp. J-068]